MAADFAFLCPVCWAIISLCQNHFFLLQFLRKDLYQNVQEFLAGEIMMNSNAAQIELYFFRFYKAMSINFLHTLCITSLSPKSYWYWLSAGQGFCV
jgi:hypothetical protein